MNECLIKTAKKNPSVKDQKMDQFLSHEELKKIGKSSEKGCYDFDLSAIYIDYWNPLKNTLIQSNSLKILEIGFNYQTYIDLQAQLKQAKNRPQSKRMFHPPIEYEGSILKNCPDVIPELIGVLSRIIPKAKTIRALSFRTMPFGLNEIEILSQSIIQCSSLRVLRFSDIPLYDNGFAKLCESLKRQSIQELQCKNCGLSDEIVPVFIDLLECHGRIQKIAEKHAEQNKEKNIGLVCLHVIDFSHNNLTTRFVDQIHDVIDASPVTSLDLTGNEEIDFSTVESPKIILENEGLANDGSLGIPAREKELERENLRLKRIVSSLVQGKDVVALRSDLYAIGDRANELAEHVRILDELCMKFENGDIEPPRPKKKKPAKKKRAQSARNRLFPY